MPSALSMAHWFQCEREKTLGYIDTDTVINANNFIIRVILDATITKDIWHLRLLCIRAVRFSGPEIVLLC